ncbi:MAG: BamA/TamA family outer membrane protein [Salibacteraceae bacterium]|nr:BamA/TamA family outer membrane protein [Salibacteraceae bacterium]
MSTLRSFIIIFSAFILLLSACKTTRHVNDGEFLVVKNKIVINDSSKVKSELKKDEFEPVVKQKPNRKLLGVLAFHLTIWNFAETHKKEKKLNDYLRNTVGEAPVIFQPVLLKQSTKQMELLLKNNGYFDGIVSADTHARKRVIFKSLKPKKKVKITYNIETGPAYRLRQINYSLEDLSLQKILDKEENELRKPVFKPGDRFQVDLFDEERSRVTDIMKNLGYFTFDQIHVLFDIDTNLTGNYYSVSIRYRNLRNQTTIDGQDTLVLSNHKKYRINQVIINENFSGADKYQVGFDTITQRNYIYLFKSKPTVRPTRLSRNIFVDKGDYFSKSKTNYTYERISSLGTFKFIDLRYESTQSDGEDGLLDLRINLTEAPKQALTLEGVGTNRSGNLGVSTSLNYKNRNIFHGAEQFDLKIYGGVEAQRTNSNISNENVDFITRNTPFNTYEVGVQGILTIPDFLFRPRKKDLPWFKEPKTNISASADRQVRPQYDRTLFNLAYQINMRIRPKDQLIFAPIDLSVIELQKDPDFEAQLLRTQNSLLINSYNNHIIPAGRISYSYTTQDFTDNEKNYHLYKINFESAGNLARGAASLFNMTYDKDRDSYIIDSIAFSQYIKLDADYTQYYILNSESKSVYRGIAGIGIPLKNLNTLPFERSFFAGGANDMRAWQARGLGPGSLADTATYGIDQVGELKLEVNLEYRFKIIKQLEGALFADIGNIWLLNYDPQRPGAEFQFQSFYKELAIGPGAGVRFDFGFFVFRLDGGLQVRDPSLPEGEKWIFEPKSLTNRYRTEANTSRVANGLTLMPSWKPEFTFNLGIGYPF